MQPTRRRWIPLAGLALLAACAGPLARTTDYDLVVYGGTPAGVTAAIEAARMGHSVVLIEPTAHVGGMTSSGLGATDIGNKAAIGGIAREFYQRVRAHYAQDSAWTFEKREEFQGRGHAPDDDAAWTFEPHVAEQVFRAMLAKARVPVMHGERLDLGRGVRMSGRRILAIRMESGREFTGRVFLDCSYEGDLMAKAGVSWRVGREANAEFGETLNGVQTAQATHHQFRVRVDPYVVPGDAQSGLLFGIRPEQPEPDGSGDQRVQAYNYRICATDVESNRVPWPKPPDYDPARYELLIRNLQAGDAAEPWNPVWMPNRKTDANNNLAVSTDFIGMNWRYPEADYAERAAIVAAHKSWVQGLLWTLANDARVPADLRATFQRFGLAQDEFPDNGNWPCLIYVREARRMVGLEVMTEHHCRGTRLAARPIGLAAYTMDSHHVQRYVDAGGAVRNEGDVQVGGFPPYRIGYGSIVPKREECVNLLVPVCLSATHIAYGSIRMEPVFMVLGQSAAAAACLAVQAGRDVQDVRYAVLHQQLLADHQVVDWESR